MNPGYSTFTSFYTFLENAGLVLRTQDTVFLCGSALSASNNEDPPIPNYLPASLPVDEATTACGETITFCGVGAHHQNGVTENHISRLTRVTRTSIFHAQRRWPEAVGEILWPFSWKDFVRRYNDLHLDKAGLSPLQKHSQMYEPFRIRDYHTFGCTVYVLEGKLQSVGSKVPKWNPRARLGVYLGRSPCHAGSVSLVLNPRILHVSSQFHVVFDNEFTKVPFLRSGDVPPRWTQLVQFCTESSTDEAYDLATQWLHDTDSYPSGGPSNEEGPGVLQSDTLAVAPYIVPAAAPNGVHLSGSEEVVTNSMVSEEVGDTSASEEDVDPYTMTGLPNLDSVSLRRSSRTPKPSAVVLENRRQQEEAKYSKTKPKRKLYGLFTMFTLCTASVIESLVSALPTTVAHKVAYHTEKIKFNFDGTLNSLNYAALLYSASDNDTYTFKDMLHQLDAKNFVQAMMDKLEAHEVRNH